MQSGTQCSLGECPVRGAMPPEDFGTLLDDDQEEEDQRVALPLAQWTELAHKRGLLIVPGPTESAAVPQAACGVSLLWLLGLCGMLHSLVHEPDATTATVVSKLVIPFARKRRYARCFTSPGSWTVMQWTHTVACIPSSCCHRSQHGKSSQGLLEGGLPPPLNLPPRLLGREGCMTSSLDGTLRHQPPTLCMHGALPFGTLCSSWCSGSARRVTGTNR